MSSPWRHIAEDPKEGTWKHTLLLSFQSLGVVFGHLSIGPLYALNALAPSEMPSDALYGMLSFIIWTMTLIPLVKYVFVVLKTDDNGEGGTIALYSILCRHARVGLLPISHEADDELLAYEMGSFYSTWLESEDKRPLEGRKCNRYMILLMTLLGSCMVIGNGVLVPVISVFSASLGLDGSVAALFSESSGHLEEHFKRYVTVPTACTILIALFVLQHIGTHKIGFLFAPIMIVWLLFISGIGVYNIFHWNYHVIYAISPTYLFKYLRNMNIRSWRSLGGVLLSIAGSDAMFANLGHFSERSIQIAFCFLVYPCLVLCYMGQTAFLTRNWDVTKEPFITHLGASIPGGAQQVFIVLSLLASVVGSQATITATFSIINQCQSLCCFPRVKVIHTSDKIHGQIYIPDINWMLMSLCLAFTILDGDSANIGNATGFAAVIGMLITTCLMSLNIGLHWRKVMKATCFMLIFGFIEVIYLLACILNLRISAWVFLLFSTFILVIMLTWHYGTMKKYEFDFDNKVTIEWLESLGQVLGVSRLPGIGFIHTEIMTGIPAFFTHFLTNLPAFHEVLVFVSFKPVLVSSVPPSMQYIVGRIGSNDFKVYRCIVRHGYCDRIGDANSFEDRIFRAIGVFVSLENRDPETNASPEGKLIIVGNVEQEGTAFITVNDNAAVDADTCSVSEKSPFAVKRRRVRFVLPPKSPQMNAAVRKELQELVEAREHGITYLMGQSHIYAHKGLSSWRRIAMNLYIWLVNNCREPAMALNIPYASLVEVGMAYYL